MGMPEAKISRPHPQNTTFGVLRRRSTNLGFCKRTLRMSYPRNKNTSRNENKR